MDVVIVVLKHRDSEIEFLELINYVESNLGLIKLTTLLVLEDLAEVCLQDDAEKQYVAS